MMWHGRKPDFFLRAWAVVIHMDISHEPFYATIERKNARDQMEQPDLTSASAPTLRSPQCRHTVWGSEEQHLTITWYNIFWYTVSKQIMMALTTNVTLYLVVCHVCKSLILDTCKYTIKWQNFPLKGGLPVSQLETASATVLGKNQLVKHGDISIHPENKTWWIGIPVFHIYNYV